MKDNNGNERDFRKMKGLRPKHVIIDEILRLPDSDSPVNKDREEFYSHQLPTGYVPPFPTGRGEEKMAELNVRPLGFSNHARQWQEGLHQGMAAEIDHLIASGTPLTFEEKHVAETLLPLNEIELASFYKKLNEEMGPEPPGGDRPDDAA